MTVSGSQRFEVHLLAVESAAALAAGELPPSFAVVAASAAAVPPAGGALAASPSAVVSLPWLCATVGAMSSTTL